ncbi:MAG: hypothetical protein MRY77_03545 [Rhodobacteraceae bacterium]|nr:hypothetical protein [Paracoccaceae bacterium]
MSKPSLMILSLGELGTNLLEAVSRADLFGTIFVASRDLTKAQERAGNAMIGAGLEGHFPDIRAVELDLNATGFARQFSDIAPDYLFSAPSLLPWWRLDAMEVQLPFAACTSLHLALMVDLRNRLSEANHKAFWIGASYPDVINAVLNRTGFGPDCGIGNVQEPIPKIQRHVATQMGCAPGQVEVRLVAQHAFEYYVLNASAHDELPPHLLQVTVDGQDVTHLAVQALRQSFPFPYDLHFNRVTASAGVQALRALTADTPTATHLPGLGSLIGGYPVLASREGISLNLPPHWTKAQAIAANEASLEWDGIAGVDVDGTIHFAEQTAESLRILLGHPTETLTTQTAAAQAKALLAAL